METKDTRLGFVRCRTPMEKGLPILELDKACLGIKTFDELDKPPLDIL